MRRASRLFTAAQRTEIEASVTEAEARTSGEIVPVVATASGRYDRGEDLFGVILSLLLLTLLWLFFQGVVTVHGEWGVRLAPRVGLLPVLVTVLGGFLAGAVLTTRVPELKLPLVGRREIEEEVERAAAATFQRLRVRRTAQGTGVLLYVSLLERRVRVLADDAIAETVAQEEWDRVCGAIVEGLRRGRAADGMKVAIGLCGDLLATRFPAQPGDVDELENTLHLVD